MKAATGFSIAYEALYALFQVCLIGDNIYW
jgi:hypothetical protein